MQRPPETRQLSLFQPAVNAKAITWQHDPVQAFEDWLADARYGCYGRPYNEKSSRVYATMWGAFVRFLSKSHCTVLNISHIHLVAFLELQQQNNPRTRRRYAGLLDMVFRHMVKEGLREDNPARGAVRRLTPPSRRPLPVVLSRAQESSFLAIQMGNTSWKRLRDHALMRLILGAGLRLNEALALQMGDLHMEDSPPFVHVPGHGPYRERVVPIAELAHEALRTWLTCKAEKGVPGSLVFPGNLEEGEALSAATAYRQTKAALALAGITQTGHQGPHVLRDTFCVRQLANGKNLNLVQRWMGHEKEETTARFLDLIASPGGEGAV